MWTTVHVTIGRDHAFEIGEKLNSIGFLVKVKFFALEGKDELYEIVAPEFEAKDVQEAMMELGII